MGHGGAPIARPCGERLGRPAVRPVSVTHVTQRLTHNGTPAQSMDLQHRSVAGFAFTTFAASISHNRQSHDMRSAGGSNMMHIEMIDGTLRAACRALGLASCCALGLAAPGFGADAGYRIFVTNEGSGDLTVIDGATNRVTATWPLGKRPRGLVAAPDGRSLYVALSGSPLAGPGVDEKSLPPADKAADGIGVVRLTDGHIERVLSGLSDPEQVTSSPDGTRLFVASEDTGVAVVVKVADGKILARVDVGGEPEGLAVSAKAGLVGVTSEEANSVALLALKDSKLVARLKVGQRPRDLGFSTDGKSLFVSGENDASLTIIDVTARKVRQTLHLVSPGARPKGIAISPDGARVYVTTGRGGHVDVLDAASLEVIASIAVGARPWGIGLSPDGGHLYTANGPSNDVSVIDTVSLSVIATIKAGEKPWGLIVVPLVPDR
jgi:YVTN family beta-propeller protein